jgi:predicted transcriptional regulator YdeE
MSTVSHQNVSDPILIAGIQIRTNNARELSSEGGIGRLWQRFFAEGFDAQITNRTGSDLYAVYSNYASNEYGDYDFLIGVAVSSVEHLPAGVTFAAIATGKYAVVTTEQGPVAEVVPGTWKEIWNMSVEELGGKRAFITDYEIYGADATDPTNAEVDIYLGLEAEVQ